MIETITNLASKLDLRKICFLNMQHDKGETKRQNTLQRENSALVKPYTLEYKIILMSKMLQRFLDISFQGALKNREILIKDLLTNLLLNTGINVIRYHTITYIYM